MTRSELEQLMKSHDWFYEWSDDHGVRERGKQSFSIIKGALATLPHEEAKELCGICMAPIGLSFPRSR